MKILHYSIILFCAFLVFFIPSLSEEESITVSTDKTSYGYGDNYTVSGKINPVIPHEKVSILILGTNYLHPQSFSVAPSSDGRYLYTISLPDKAISSGNFTIIAQYAGAKNQTSFNYAGLPCNQQNIPAYVISAPIIRGPPAFNPRILDSLGNAVIGPVKVGQQIQISYKLENGLNCNMPFVYLVQIQDHNGITVSLSWITGTLLAGQSFYPAQSWTPQHNDTYTAQIFTWQSLDNPNALVPPASVSFVVVPNANFTQSSQIVSEMPSKFRVGSQTTVQNSPLQQFKSGIAVNDVKCEQGLQLVIKTEDSSPACVTSQTVPKLVEHGWTLVTNNSKLTHMDIKVFSSYTPSSLKDHFLTGSLYSSVEPIQNGNITITVNGAVMGTTKTYPNGCFQFNNWNDSKLTDQINKSKSLGMSSMELNFQTQYFGGSNHSPANASAISYLGFYAVPLAPAQYDTGVYPSNQINVTQGDSAQFHITVKPFSKYWEVGHMKLNLQRMPCGLSYGISPVGNNDSVLVNNTPSFDVVLNSTSYTPSGKYWISIDQDLPRINEQIIDSNVGAFFLNVLKK